MNQFSNSDKHNHHHHCHNNHHADEENGENGEQMNGKNESFQIPLIEKEQVSSLSNEEKKKIFENCVKNMITLMGEDYEREGLVKTPSRVFHSFESLCEGYNVKDPKEILGKALFSSDNSQMVVIRDIETYSLCEHHLLPVIGKCHVAYIPNGKVVGLSKIPRLVDVYARRLQIQEELTEQIAQAIVETIQPEGVGVVIEARHLCMEMRGVKTTQSTTITSSLKGQFLKKETRKEFFDIINRNASNRL